MGFNTQPPEGGWGGAYPVCAQFQEFQHTAARRRLGRCIPCMRPIPRVSTHSRPKAAGLPNTITAAPLTLFQHTAARRRLAILLLSANSFAGVSTHSRPKAAGQEKGGRIFRLYCFNTQPPEGGWSLFQSRHLSDGLFQHTAARRRLDLRRGRH